MKSMQALIDLREFAKIGCPGAVSSSTSRLPLSQNETCVCNSHSQIQIPDISVHLAIQHVNVLANLMVIGQQGRSPGKFAMLEISEKYVWIHEKSRYYITTCHGHAFQSLHAPFFESSRLQTHGSPEVPLLNESRFKWPGPWCPWHTKTGEDVRKYLSDPLRVSTEHLHLFPLTHPDFGGIILVSCDMCLHSGSCSWHCEWI